MPKKAKRKVESPFTGDDLRAYIREYIDSYMDQVEDMGLEEEEFPIFYTSYPFDVTAYILKDNSTCIVFKGHAPVTSINIKHTDLSSVDSKLSIQDYDHVLCYSPSQPYTEEEAKVNAGSDVAEDVENIRQLKDFDAPRVERDNTLRTMKHIMIVNPWLAIRKSPGSVDVVADNKEKAAGEIVRKESEDFSAYSERLNAIKSSPMDVPEPSGVEMPPEVKEPPEPPKPEEPTETKTVTVDPGQETVHVPGTNINIQIKQPEGAQEFKGDKDYDMLRVKKTLYKHTTKIETLDGKTKEISGKMEGMDQIKQTVFRMNRKTHDNEAKMSQMEKINAELVKKMNALIEEQRIENKKMRRFIIERARKARNQAMFVAIVALIIAILTIPFLIILLMNSWDEVKGFLGM